MEIASFPWEIFIEKQILILRKSDHCLFRMTFFATIGNNAKNDTNHRSNWPAHAQNQQSPPKTQVPCHHSTSTSHLGRTILPSRQGCWSQRCQHSWCSQHYQLHTPHGTYTVRLLRITPIAIDDWIQVHQNLCQMQKRVWCKGHAQWQAIKAQNLQPCLPSRNQSATQTWMEKRRSWVPWPTGTSDANHVGVQNVQQMGNPKRVWTSYVEFNSTQGLQGIWLSQANTQLLSFQRNCWTTRHLALDCCFLEAT